jgi:hypothetical protein
MQWLKLSRHRNECVCYFQVDTKGFWRWCITFGITEFLDLSIVRDCKERNVSETGSVSILRWKGGRHLLFRVPYKGLTSIIGCNIEFKINALVVLVNAVAWNFTSLSPNCGKWFPLRPHSSRTVRNWTTKLCRTVVTVTAKCAYALCVWMTVFGFRKECQILSPRESKPFYC